MIECCQGEGAVPTSASISSTFLGEQALSTSLPLSVSRTLSSILMAIPLKLWSGNEGRGNAGHVTFTASHAFTLCVGAVLVEGKQMSPHSTHCSAFGPRRCEVKSGARYTPGSTVTTMPGSSCSERLTDSVSCTSTPK